MKTSGTSNFGALRQATWPTTSRFRSATARKTHRAQTRLRRLYTSAPLTGLGQNYANGHLGLTPDDTGDFVPYYFDVTLNAATPNSEQGETATVSFTWEVVSVSS